ncbi:MAG: hypothetical protein R3A48_25400 [Polyangiales bacterium]
MAVVAAALAAFLLSRDGSRGAATTSRRPEGPWGRLERMPFHLEQPPRFLTPDLCYTQPPAWVLPGFTRERVRELLASADGNARDSAAMVQSAVCNAEGCTVTPTANFGLQLSTTGRETLYQQIGRFEVNTGFAYPYSQPVGEDRWSDLGDIVDLSLVQRLTWRRGNTVNLSDSHLLCAAARNDEERLRIVEALTRMSATMVWLELDRSSDVDALVRYWGRGSSGRDLRPILRALSQRSGGGRLDVVHLLPPFVRRRLNTFALPGDPPRDCYWTALHFFSLSQPLDAFVNGAGAEEILNRDYEQVPMTSLTLGDVLLFVVPGVGPVHAANHVADDLVFTKNGAHMRRPWSLLTLDEVRDLYPEATELRAYRLRQLPTAPQL